MGHKKKRKQAAPTARTAASKPWLLYAGFGMILTILFLPLLGTVSDWGAERAKPKEPAKRAAAERPQAVMPTAEGQFQWQERHQPYVKALVASIDAAAKGDARAESLARQFKENLLLMRLLPGGITMAAFPIGEEPSLSDKPVAKLVVMTHDEARRQLPGWTGEAFSYARGDFQFVEIPIEATTLGVVALHEMSHWDDIELTKREQPSASGDEWAMGEVRAHALEDAAVDRLTNGRFAKRIAETLGDGTLCAVIAGMRQCTPTAAGYDRILSAFPNPEAGPYDHSLRRAIALIGVLFRQAKTDRERIDVYRWVLKANSRLPG